MTRKLGLLMFLSLALSILAQPSQAKEKLPVQIITAVKEIRVDVEDRAVAKWAGATHDSDNQARMKTIIHYAKSSPKNSDLLYQTIMVHVNRYLSTYGPSASDAEVKKAINQRYSKKQENPRYGLIADVWILLEMAKASDQWSLTKNVLKTVSEIDRTELNFGRIDHQMQFPNEDPSEFEQRNQPMGGAVSGYLGEIARGVEEFLLFSSSRQYPENSAKILNEFKSWRQSELQKTPDQSLPFWEQHHVIEYARKLGESLMGR